MKRFLLPMQLLLSACAAPGAQRPSASTEAVHSPRSGATPPLTHCCSSPTDVAASEAQLPAPPPPPPRPFIAPDPPEPAAPATAAAGEIATAKTNRAFAVSLYRQLAAKPGNIFISPISLASAFGPVAWGARGRTRAEIGKVLGFPADDKVLNADFGSMLRTLEGNGGGHEVSIANALWLGKGWSIKPDFVAMARRRYDSDVDTLNFGDAAAAAAQINDWVNRKTNNRIPKLFDPTDFDAGTALVVTNAVHFLGEWREAFDPRQTRVQPFYLSDGTTRDVPMMSSEHMRSVYLGGGEVHPAADSVELLEMPYKGNRLSMVVILPSERNGLPAVEAGLSADKLDKWLARLDSAKLFGEEVQLPRMQLESSYELVKPLKALGMRTPFTNAANFTGISTDRGNPLYIDTVVHKTFLKVDEQGTEAAAATGIAFRGERDHWSFRADHPFLFLIRDKPTGAILFMGRFSEPLSAS
jgi:serpin B